MHLLQSCLELQLSVLCLMLFWVQQAGHLLTMVPERKAHCVWGFGSLRGPI